MAKTIYSSHSAEVKKYKDEIAKSVLVTLTSFPGSLYVPIELISRALQMRRDNVIRSAKRYLGDKLVHVPVRDIVLRDDFKLNLSSDDLVSQAYEYVIHTSHAFKLLDHLENTTLKKDIVRQLRELIKSHFGVKAAGMPQSRKPDTEQLPADAIIEGQYKTTPPASPSSNIPVITRLRVLLAELLTELDNLEAVGRSNLPTTEKELADFMEDRDMTAAKNENKAALDSALSAHALANNLIAAGGVPFENAQLEAGRVFVSEDLRNSGWVTVTDLWKDYVGRLPANTPRMKQEEFLGLVYWTFCEKLRDAAGNPVVKTDALHNKLATVVRVRIPDVAAHARTIALLDRHPKRPAALAHLAATWVFQLWFSAAAARKMREDFDKLMNDWKHTGFVKHAVKRSEK